MAGLADFRAAHPEYNDMSDSDLADALYKKSYSDMSREDFNKKLGIEASPVVRQPTAPERAKRGLDIPMLPPKPRTTGEELAHDVNATGTALYKGLADIVGFPGDLYQMGNSKQAQENYARMSPMAQKRAQATSNVLVPLMEHLPTTLGTQNFMFDTLGIPKVEPDTRLGKIAEKGVEMIPSAALAPSSMAKAVIPMFAGGAASEAAGQATEGTPYEEWARLIAGIATPSVLGFRSMMRSTPGGILAKQTADMTPAEWAAAQALEGKGRDIGVKLTGPEAIGNQGLLTLQRQVERGGGEGGAAMDRFMKARPPQVQRAGEAANLMIGPKIEDVPTTTTKISQAATDVIERAQNARTTAVDPHYKAMEGAPFTQGQAILDKVDAEIAKRGAEPIMNQLTMLRKELADELNHPSGPRLDALNSIYKYWRDKIELPEISPQATPAGTQARIAPILDDLNNRMSRENPDYAYGRHLYEHLSDTQVKPLVEGAPGKMAETKTTADQIAMVADPKTARPATITDVVTRLHQENPEAARDLVRLHLENTFAEATKNLVSGPNQFGGAKFVKELTAGARGANIEAAIRALPGGDRIWQGYTKMLQVFEATGRRLPVGSMTAENIASRETLQGGGLASIAKTASGPLRAIRDWAEGLRYGKNTAALAKIFTDPESVKKIRELAFLAPGAARTQALVLSILGGVGADKQGNEQQPPATMAPAP